jgi:hypothetical protein
MNTTDRTEIDTHYEPVRKPDAEMIREYGLTARLALRLEKHDSLDLDDAFDDVMDTCERVRDGELSAQAASLELFDDGSAADDILNIVDGGQ